MKKLFLLVMGVMVLATGCSREVYINKQTQIIREKETASDVRVIDREKEVRERDSEVIHDRTTPSRRKAVQTDGEFKTVVD